MSPTVTDSKKNGAKRGAGGGAQSAGKKLAERGRGLHRQHTAWHPTQ